MVSIKEVFDLLEKVYKITKEAKKETRSKDLAYIELKLLSQMFVSKLDMTYKHKSEDKDVSLVDRGIALRGSGSESIIINTEEIKYLTDIENSFNDLYSNSRELLDNETLESLKKLTLKMAEYRGLFYHKGRIATARLYKLRMLTTDIIDKTKNKVI